MPLSKTIRLLAVGFITFYVPFTFANQKTNWLKELMRLGFEGCAISPRASDWGTLHLGHKVFVVKSLPSEAEYSPIWRNLNGVLLEELRAQMAEGDLQLIMADGSHPRAPYAGVKRCEGLILIWTPQAGQITLVHEAQHLKDYRVNLDLQALENLRQLGFTQDSLRVLRKYIFELRAHTVQADFASPAKLEEIRENLDFYLEEVRAALSTQPDTQKLKYATLVRAYMSDLKSNAESESALKKLEALSCEQSLVLKSSKR